MQLVVLAQPSFFQESLMRGTLPSQGDEAIWAEAYRSALSQAGVSVRVFKALDRIDWKGTRVQILGGREAETWAVLTQFGARVVVTPWKSEKTYRSEQVARVLRSLLQRRWPPLDEREFRKKAEVIFPSASLTQPLEAARATVKWLKGESA